MASLAETQRILWRNPEHRARMLATRQRTAIVWTPDMDAVLIEMAAAGRPLQDAADRIGVSWNTARNRVVALWMAEKRRTQSASPGGSD